MRVLICDDHAVFAESLAVVLHRAGYEVSAVTHSPAEALAALAHDDVDLCVLDALFPGGSIISWLPRLRAAAPNTRSILLSADADPNLIQQALAAGMCAVTRKNADITEICTTLDRVQNGEVVGEGPGNGSRARPAPSVEAQRLARQLTGREREVLCHLVSGKDTKGVARSMGVTWSTARGQIQGLLAKLGVHSRLQATTTAVRHGLVDGESAEWLL